MRVTHLDKSGSGMAARTACGRNILRTPISTNWEEFKKEKPELRCAKCVASKQAALNARRDAAKVQEDAPLVDDNGGTEWIPEDPEVTAARDAELIAAHRAKKNVAP